LRGALAHETGVFLSEGGSRFFTVFAGSGSKPEPVVNFGRRPSGNLHLSVKFLDAKGAPAGRLIGGLRSRPARRRHWIRMAFPEIAVKLASRPV
jgi:hypothetical protein